MVIPMRAKGLTQALGPDAGGAVMATGIVSVAIRADGHETLSLALLALTATAWALLGGAIVRRVSCDRQRWRAEAQQLASLTAVAGTAVLGARLALLGWYWAGWTLLAIATALCLTLVRGLRKARALPSSGAAFLLVVAPESLAVLAAVLAGRLGLRWFAFVALLPFAFGLCAYVLVLTRFDFAQLRTGAGDHWVSGGALAISTLACAELARAITTVRAVEGLHDLLRIATLVLWVLSMLWLPALIVGEARWPRWRYDVCRWATVFPLGMYAVMSFAAGAATGSAWLVSFGRAWAWVALAAWAATTLGAARAVRACISSPAPSSSQRSG
jgi:Voltage-dependent anion channel